MNLFEEIVLESELLTESVSVNSVVDAITGMHPAWITYDDGQGGGGKARRLIYPIAYGATRTKNPEDAKPVIRAFEPSGSSKRGLTNPPNPRQYPKWKYFRLDRIKSWRTINSKTYDPEDMDGYEDTDSNRKGIVNTEGDKSMSAVYVIAPIGNAKKIRSQEFEKPDNQQTPQTTTTSFEPRPITKDEVEGIEIEPVEQPVSNGRRKLTAKMAVDSIINWIKKYGNKVGQGIKNIFNKKLDNQPENNNINNTGDTINAPETKPTTKGEIGTSVNDELNSNEQLPAPNDKPVTKQEVDSEGEENKDLKENVLTKSYKDMMSRMNNLYK